MRNWEIDANILDYTWNWPTPYGYAGRDYRPLTSVFPTPRLNYCIDSSPLAVKRAFADNLYLCIMPRRPESANGSDSIVRYPAYSQALKQCAALRKQFLKYFTDGVLIGECLLSEPCPAHVTSYVLSDRALMIVLNDGAARSIDFACDLAAWLKSPSGRYRVTAFGEDGRSRGTSTTSSRWRGQTGRLAAGEMMLFEIRAE